MISDAPIVNLDITGNVLNCPAATKGNLTVIYYQATEKYATIPSHFPSGS